MDRKNFSPKRSIGPLKLWRVSKQLTQLHVSSLLGYASPNSYQEIEQGRHFMHENRLRELDAKTGTPGIMVAYVCWYFEFSEDQLRTVLMSQPTSGVVLL